MQQRKTVTLIDLEGKPFVDNERIKEHFNGYFYFTGNFELYPDSEIKKLMDFLNAQLVYRRNKQWETLSIYQATLGRYWEVPWYNPKVLVPKHEQNYNVRALDEYDPRKGYFNQEFTDLEGCQYCANEKEFTWAMFVHDHLVIGLGENVPERITAMAIQPMLDDFLQHYQTIYSKLTTWKG